MHKRNTFFSTFVFALVLLQLVSSCSSQQVFTLNTNIVTPQPTSKDDAKNISFNADSVLLENKTLMPTLSKQSVLLSHAISIDSTMREMVRLKQDTTPQSIQHYLALNNRVQNKVMLAMNEIDAVAGIFDSEGEQLDQIEEMLANKNSEKSNTLTVASIVVGAASAIAGAYISNDSWNKGVALGTGLLGATLGFATLTPKGKHVFLVHKHNSIRACWQQTNENNFPFVVWYMLNEPYFNNRSSVSLLETMKQKWLSFVFKNDQKAVKNSVLFTNEGVYYANDLQTRSQMVGQMQAVIRSLYQHLSVLLKEISLLTPHRS